MLLEFVEHTIRPSAELRECDIPPSAAVHAPADPPGGEILLCLTTGVLTLRVESSPPAMIPPGGSARLISDRARDYANESNEPLKCVRLFQNGTAHEASAPHGSPSVPLRANSPSPPPGGPESPSNDQHQPARPAGVHWPRREVGPINAVAPPGQ